MSNKEIKKIVLAYSGGLDTSVIVPWLIEKYGCEVIACIANLGQDEDMESVKKKALSSGAKKAYMFDLREEFAADYIFPTLRAGAVYEDEYLLGTSFARPLIAKKQVEVAEKENADAVSHGATGKGNDQVRFELTYYAMNPKLKVIAPWREPDWNLVSREICIDYAKKHNIPLSQTKKKIYSEDGNLWHLSHEGGVLEDPANETPSDIFKISVAPEKAPNKTECVEIEFERGTPVKINGKKLSPAKIIETLNIIGARNAIGQVDLVENRLVGMKSRGVYETPGGAILYFAHRKLESLTLDKETMHYKQIIALKYGELVYNGQWFTPLKEAIDAFVDSTQKFVSGKVKIKLYKGTMRPASITSPYSLFRGDIATFGKSLEYSHSDATGFLRLFGLPVKICAGVHRKK
ncbi:MAG TPA: argininosuccinate synthase [bacterium]|nr:argininosuccinate synthase [bacterium]HPN30360.1 argininosuccinate synthase [bacterium]